MRDIVLDIETTGLEYNLGHKIIDIAFQRAFEELMLTLTTSENSHLSKNKYLKII